MHSFSLLSLKERKRGVRNYRTKKVTKRPAEIRTGDLSLTGRMLFRLSHKSRSVVNGVRIRLSQSIPSQERQNMFGLVKEIRSTTRRVRLVLGSVWFGSSFCLLELRCGGWRIVSFFSNLLFLPNNCNIL